MKKKRTPTKKKTNRAFNKTKAEKKRVVATRKEPSRKKPAPAKEPLPIVIELPFTPEQTRELWAVYDRARYGEESQSPLFWDLEKLHGPYGETYEYLNKHGIRGINASAEADNYVYALYSAWKDEQHQEKLPADFELLPPSLFYDWATIAVRRRDFLFFEEVARLLRDKIVPAKEDLECHYLISAYRELKQPGMEPTKKEVREKARSNWKTWNLIKKRERPWNGKMPTSAEILLEKIPKPNWTRAFKRCGLSRLPSNKGGQPSHKKRPFCVYSLPPTPNQCR